MLQRDWWSGENELNGHPTYLQGLKMNSILETGSLNQCQLTVRHREGWLRLEHDSHTQATVGGAWGIILLSGATYVYDEQRQLPALGVT